ncbi:MULTISPECIES: succinate dehydrogenase, hydrophobic membrane anchor protein [Pseudoalteromonas]|uniref:Succinate dehydrogenase hydrophobic membrane anchor subunit n=1 Tax=Pseudoalteromonas haloplanktis TaxID=228 RepID=A0ABU1B8Z4_PSEHA|nr:MULTISPECIES: succinate dehydrogenase, hydrophobic membrane anchor protein [Pseudoalteromonas]MCF6142831.1 succinate dehydrogenase membrane anchor subunit [Pseudoalteromonas mariniglutinosa NCIMB 1770]MDQ9090791.1 succinate dehydrogenase, hydrophobic membrane anchor protein [Pseudoalteromonas haloplanktis]TMN70827.1 succinate dehydrogenase, hydrophobic membrane anchor protein [Pseudoalteromonas sp. S1727]BDF94422.1 succinate dehydrogenase hydrophobic membrane anchor subunit [Pseudoalteromona
MVLNQATLKRDGVQDYVSLRTTALVITAYAIFIIGYFLCTPEVTFEAWQSLFSNLAMKGFTLITLVCIMVHTRIGLWQVLTDYVKCATLRAVLGFVLNLMAVAYVAIGLIVLWGV